MKTVHHYTTDTAPAEIVVKLDPSGKLTDLLAINAWTQVASGQHASAENPEETITDYVYEVTATTDSAPHPATYDAIVEALIALRYTTGAEIALTRKPDTDTEKVDYLAFVAAAKEAAKEAIL